MKQGCVWTILPVAIIAGGAASCGGGLIDGGQYWLIIAALLPVILATRLRNRPLAAQALVGVALAAVAASMLMT